jgi:hypothetical protein
MPLACRGRYYHSDDLTHYEILIYYKVRNEPQKKELINPKYLLQDGHWSSAKWLSYKQSNIDKHFHARPLSESMYVLIFLKRSSRGAFQTVPRTFSVTAKLSRLIFIFFLFVANNFWCSNYNNLHVKRFSFYKFLRNLFYLPKP